MDGFGELCSVHQFTFSPGPQHHYDLYNQREGTLCGTATATATDADAAAAAAAAVILPNPPPSSQPSTSNSPRILYLCIYLFIPQQNMLVTLLSQYVPSMRDIRVSRRVYIYNMDGICNLERYPQKTTTTRKRTTDHDCCNPAYHQHQHYDQY